MDDPTATTGHLVLVSVSEAAAACGLPEATIRRWIDEGTVTAIPFGPTPMVSVAEVASVRDRLAGKPGHQWARRPWLRALGAANIVAGLVGAAAVLGIGPARLREPWWLALCVVSALVGLLLLRASSSAKGRPRRRPGGPDGTVY